MRTKLLSLIALTTLAMVGCGGTQGSARAQRAPTEQECPCPGMQQQGGERMAGMMCPGMGEGGMAMGMQCPMCAPLPAGASVRSEPIEGGVALTFTTPDEQDVDALRARVRAMAEAHQQHHGAGAREEGEVGAMGRMRMPPSTARAIDVERGARLELRAVDDGDVEALRAHVEQMRACPMMAGQMPAEEPAG